MNSLEHLHRKKMALLAGSSLLIMAIFAGVGYGYAFNVIYKSNHAAATLQQLQQSHGLLRLTIACFTAIMVLDVVVAWTLHELFKNLNQSLASITTMFRLVYAAVLAASLFNLLNVLELLKLSPQNPEIIMLHMNLFLSTWSWGLIVFGCHLFLLGILVYQCGFLPRIIGYVANFAGLCYIISNTLNLLFPAYQLYKDTVDVVLALPMALGELLLAGWLIRLYVKKSIHL
jgi:hypothetical protein